MLNTQWAKLCAAHTISYPVSNLTAERVEKLCGSGVS